MISMVNVTKRYRTRNGSLTVLDDVNMDFPFGVNIGVLGGNGAGKSTLLRLLGGAEEPTKGKIFRQGTISWPIGFQGGLQRSLTAFDNIRFISRIFDKDLAHVVKFVEDFTELGDRLATPVGTYSSGMRAKLAFAVSMAIDFDYYLIDELTAVGDARFRAKCAKEFERRRKKSTIIIVSHNISTVKQYSEIILILNKGRFEKYDDVEEGLARYQQL